MRLMSIRRPESIEGAVLCASGIALVLGSAATAYLASPWSSLDSSIQHEINACAGQLSPDQPTVTSTIPDECIPYKPEFPFEKPPTAKYDIYTLPSAAAFKFKHAKSAEHQRKGKTKDAIIIGVSAGVFAGTVSYAVFSAPFCKKEDEPDADPR